MEVVAAAARSGNSIDCNGMAVVEVKDDDVTLVVEKNPGWQCSRHKKILAALIPTPSWARL